ncbi:MULTISPECIES: hypothetical protein [Pseudomonas]|uniref:hypothetical protein n=1 Tax=Pseudomonas TaxID=286 RepID=UPI000C0EE431|nr:hypothetical protein [Pseudomonas aeruginosa]MBP1351394.1 hypothetical protein [Pseudomonas aeruginosa]MBP1361555.1 hypothetical protein [Pseudomonas aeruginosa]MBQ56759.1 hypothetical protein [Pseudomonadaceae bacterium]
MLKLKKGYTERDFGKYTESLGHYFCNALVSAYEIFWPDNSSTEVTYFYPIIKFLDFLAEDGSQEELRNFLKTGEISDPGESYIVVLFHNLMSGYRSNLDKLEIENRTKNNYAAGVRAFVRHLANRGVVPHGLNIKGFQFERGIGSTLLDVTIHKEVDIQALISQHQDTLISEGLDDLEGMESLLSNLFNEAGACASLEDSFDIVEASTRVLDSRLGALKSASADLVVQHYKLLQDARRWASNQGYQRKAKGLRDMFEQPAVGVIGGQAAKVMGAECAMIMDGCALQVIVTYCHIYHGGIYPFDKDASYAFLANRIQKSGISISDVRSALGYSREARVAAFVWLSINYAINPDALLNLATNCLIPIGNDGQYQFVWNKLRKGAENQESVVVSSRIDGVALTCDTLTAVDVVEYLRVCTENIRDFAREEDRNSLFIGFYKNYTKGTGGERVHVPSKLALNTINMSFKSLCREVSGERWSSTLKALRGSVLLLTGLVTRDAMQVMQVGRHSDLTMAAKYTHHLPEILRREKKVREFLDWFETVLTVNIDQFAEKVGIDPEAYDIRKQRILNQQFGGIHCSDPMAGVQPGTIEGKVCHRIDKCVSCSNRRSLFLATKENIANVIHWREVLAKAEECLGEEQFSRWSLWKLFVSSVLDRLYSAREQRRLLTQAEEYCNSHQNPYVDVIPVFVIEEASV